MKILKYIGAGGLTEIDRWWTEEFGRHNSIDFWGFVLDVLKGCVIDGVAYGDTTFYNPVGVNEEKTLGTYTLFQNYPNPFNSSTVIKYSLPSTTFVMLTLYNNLGEEVKELAREEQTAGVYEYQFTSEDLPSGLYFYRIVSGNFSATKKMILLK
ncbi:T9SS type A sorting domain-containing protein [Bacteroidota bacterium]